jgi:Family of unknown function (DUF5317)
MFVLYALAIGVGVGMLCGGRPAGLGALRFRWSVLIVAGLAVQVVLFSAPVADRVGTLGPAIYVASSALMLAAILANRSIRGMGIVALGAASNLAAIVANGGYMPASQAAMGALGKTDPTSYSNSDVVANPALAPLTDVFVLPGWLPFANVFSVGDVLIGIGIAVTIVAAMRDAPRAEPASTVEGAPVTT